MDERKKNDVEGNIRSVMRQSSSQGLENHAMGIEKIKKLTTPGGWKKSQKTERLSQIW